MEGLLGPVFNLPTRSSARFEVLGEIMSAQSRLGFGENAGRILEAMQGALFGMAVYELESGVAADNHALVVDLSYRRCLSILDGQIDEDGLGHIKDCGELDFRPFSPHHRTWQLRFDTALAVAEAKSGSFDAAIENLSSAIARAETGDADANLWEGGDMPAAAFAVDFSKRVLEYLRSGRIPVIPVPNN